MMVGLKQCAVLQARLGQMWTVKQHVVLVLNGTRAAQCACTQCTRNPRVHLAKPLHGKVVAAGAESDKANQLGVWNIAGSNARGTAPVTITSHLDPPELYFSDGLEAIGCHW
jgi:hypothetical protein